MATYTGNLNLKKPDQSDKIRIADFNGNSDAIDAAIGADFGVGSNPSIDDAVNSMGGGLAIISNGNTHAAITPGKYVYVRDHGTLAEGLYVATASIAQNGTLSLNNVSAVSGGGLNALSSKLEDYSNSDATQVGSNWTSGIIRAHRRGYIVTLKLDGAVLSAASARTQIALVPEGYRPVTEVGMRSDDGTRGFIIGGGGDLRMEPQSAGTVWGSVTYVCNR